jgi:hypothetical protein
LSVTGPCDKRAKSLKPFPFLNMAQKAATYVKIILMLTLWREKLKKTSLWNKLFFSRGLLRALFWDFFAVSDNSIGRVVSPISDNIWLQEA